MKLRSLFFIYVQVITGTLTGQNDFGVDFSL